MNNGIIDPVNHELTELELKNSDYSKFLDELTDVPSSIPLKPYSINKAGISNQMAYVQIRSLFDNSYQPMLCNITMQVELDGHRGIHMSRCEEALFSLVDQKHESLDQFAEKLAIELQGKQDSMKSFVSIEGTYIATRKTVRTNRDSHDRMTFFAEANADGYKVSKKMGIAAFNMTGCPCTETFTKFSVVPKLLESGFELEQIKKILSITNSGTHTQRGLAKLVLDNPDKGLTYKMIFDALDTSCHLVFELLKRPDEHELVVRALRKPQFTEDVVRDIVDATVKNLSSFLQPSSQVFASSLLYDSIHIHDVYTEICKPLSELESENERKISTS